MVFVVKIEALLHIIFNFSVQYCQNFHFSWNFLKWRFVKLIGRQRFVGFCITVHCSEYFVADASKECVVAVALLKDVLAFALRNV